MNCISFINFSEIEKWHIESFAKNSINSQYPLFSLGKIIRPRKERVKSSDVFQKMPTVEKIRFADGKYFFRDTPIKNDVYIAYEGDLLVSNINFEKGAFAIIQEPTIACSTDYQPYEIIYSEIDPTFLELVLRSSFFLSHVTKAKPQGMKVRAKYDFIKNIKIPVPSLEMQKILVENFSKDSNASDNLNTSIDNYLLSLINVNIIGKSSQSNFTLTAFKNLDRWDIASKKNRIKSEQYPIISFGRLILGKPVYGANVKGIKKQSETRYIRITDINENGLLNEEFVSPEIIDEQYLLQEDDFLIARSGNTVGKTFLYKSTFGRAIYAGYLVKYILNQDKIYPEYLLHYTQSSAFKSWVEDNQRIAGQPNINGQEYLLAPIVLPPIEKQKEIAESISKLKAEKLQKQNMQKNRVDQAKTNFEKAIFNL